MKIVRPGVREGYDLWAETYETTANPVVAMDARHTLRILNAQPGERILDAGCGTGRNLRALVESGIPATGLDFSLGMLRVARRELPHAPLIQADLHQPLPFPAGIFDTVLCALIGEHLDRLDLVLRGFHQVLKDSGRLVFSVYHPDLAAAGKEANFELDDTQYRLGAVRYTLDDYRSLLRQARFHVVGCHEFDSTLLVLASRKSEIR
jgi:SAM-dependent methyltransferase